MSLKRKKPDFSDNPDVYVHTPDVRVSWRKRNYLENVHLFNLFSQVHLILTLNKQPGVIFNFTYRCYGFVICCIKLFTNIPCLVRQPGAVD